MSRLFKGIEKRDLHLGFEKLDVLKIGRNTEKLCSNAYYTKPKGLDVKRFFASAALAILASVAPMTQASTLTMVGGNSSSKDSVNESITAHTKSFSEFRTISNSSFSQSVDANYVISANPYNSVSKILKLDTEVIRGKSASIVRLDSKLHPNTIASFDADEHERMAVFKEMGQGWDFGKGEPLRAESIRSFDRFFAPGNFAPNSPSLFMSSAGNLVVNYDNEDGSTVELEFLADGISYYIDSQEEASVISGTNAGEFRRKISRDLTIRDARRFTG